MPVGAALAVSSVAGAGIGAVAAGSAARRQANAATEAARIQAEAANRAANLQLGMFNTIRGDLGPYRQIGASALPGIQALLGLTPQRPTTAPGYAGSAGGALTYDPTTGAFTAAPDPAARYGNAGQPDWGAYLTANPDVMQWYQESVADPERRAALGSLGIDSPEAAAEYHFNQYPGERAAPPTISTQPALGGADGSAGIQSYLENLPGYQFIRQQGTQAVENGLIRKGLGGQSGVLGKGLARFVTGLADSTYGEQLNRLMGVAGIGQNAATQTGTFGTSAASGAGNSLIGGANASAAGINNAAAAGAAGTVGAANAAISGINGAANGYLTSRFLGSGIYGGAGYPSTNTPPINPNGSFTSPGAWG